jgi:hypothetical protein
MLSTWQQLRSLIKLRACQKQKLNSLQKAVFSEYLMIFKDSIYTAFCRIKTAASIGL